MGAVDFDVFQGTARVGLKRGDPADALVEGFGGPFGVLLDGGNMVGDGPQAAEDRMGIVHQIGAGDGVVGGGVVATAKPPLGKRA